MPKVLEVNGYKLFFFSNEGNPLEPAHIHIRKGSSLAKYWVEPRVELEESYGFNSKELSEIEIIVSDNVLKIKEAWNEFFSR